MIMLRFFSSLLHLVCLPLPSRVGLMGVLWYGAVVVPALQEEYVREKIQWTFIEFPDNKDCIELIDRKPNGIIPTLDEQVCVCVCAPFFVGNILFLYVLIPTLLGFCGCFELGRVLVLVLANNWRARCPAKCYHARQVLKTQLLTHTHHELNHLHKYLPSAQQQPLG